MSRALKPQFQEEELGINPFIQNLEILVRTVDREGEYRKEDDVLVPVTFELEYLPSSKIYCDAIRRKIISNCGPNSVKLFMWIVYDIKYGEDFIWLNKTRYMEETSTSKNTLVKAINELHRYCIINPTIIKDVYWINPDFFFKGSRVNKYPDKVKEYIPKTSRKTEINTAPNKHLYGTVYNEVD